jgi:hypothetical protein
MDSILGYQSSRPKETPRMEEILTYDRYAFTLGRIVDVLRVEHDDIEQRINQVHAALRLAGIDMGEVVVVGDMIRPTKRLDLVEELALLEPDPCSGDYENPVKIMLGIAGDVWPESIRKQPAQKRKVGR